jgi:hypothetical protein
MIGIVHGVLGALVLSSPNFHNTTLGVSGDWACTSTRPICLAWAHDIKKSVWTLYFDPNKSTA